MAPAGYLTASVEDMGRYLLMLLADGRGSAGPVLSPQAARATLAPGSPPARVQLLSASFDSRYAEGWFVGPFGAVEDARWHLGSLQSFAAWMVLLPRTRQAVVVLMNANCELPVWQVNAAFSRIPIGIVNLLAGRQPPAGISLADAYRPTQRGRDRVTRRALRLRMVGRRRGGRIVVIACASAAALLAAAMSATDVGWRGLAQFAPDMTLWLGALVLHLLAPGVARLWAHVRRSAR